MHKLMDTSEVPQVHVVRKPMAGLLSMLLVLLAFIFKVVSILRQDSKGCGHHLRLYANF